MNILILVLTFFVSACIGGTVEMSTDDAGQFEEDGSAGMSAGSGGKMDKDPINIITATGGRYDDPGGDGDAGDGDSTSDSGLPVSGDGDGDGDGDVVDAGTGGMQQPPDGGTGGIPADDGGVGDGGVIDEGPCKPLGLTCGTFAGGMRMCLKGYFPPTCDQNSLCPDVPGAACLETYCVLLCE